MTSLVAAAKRRAKHIEKKAAAAHRRANMIAGLRKRAKEKTTMPHYGTASSVFTDTDTSSTIWPTWNQQYAITNNSGTLTGTGTAWARWATYSITGPTTAATNNQIIWGNWQAEHYNRATINGQATNDWLFDPNGTLREAARITMQRWTEAHQETVEQREARARADAERQRIWDAGAADRAAAQAARDRLFTEAEAKRLAAKRRAMELLYLVLSTSQKKMLEDKKFFLVDAASGRRYRIDQGNHQNVKVVDKVTGDILETLCVQPDGLPDGDVMLIQKLLIETAEQAFRDTANISEWGTYRRISSSKHLLTGDKLAEILNFPQGGRDAQKPDFGELVAAVEAVAEEQAAERAA